MTRDEMRGVMTDAVAVICTIVGEAALEPIEGQVAVACVIRNRVRHPRWWGRGWKNVCHARAQFSCWWEQNENTARVYALADALMRRQVPDGAPTSLSQVQWVATGVMEDRLMDSTKSADHYLTTALLRAAPPTWAQRKPPVCTRGAHTFFRLEI